MEALLVSIGAFLLLFGGAYLIFQARRRETARAAREGLLPPPGRRPTTEHVRKCAQAGKMVLAIKLYRQMNPKSSLAQAREAVEALGREPDPADKSLKTGKTVTSRD